MKKLIVVITALVLALVIAAPAIAATSADVTVRATPSFVSIANNLNTYNFGTIAVSTNTSTPSDHFLITNTSSVAINIAIAVTTNTWSGGVGWTHSDTAIAGVNTAGLRAGTGGTNNIIIKYDTPNNLVSGLAANTNYNWNMQMVAPTEFTDGVQKEITVRLTATTP